MVGVIPITLINKFVATRIKKMKIKAWNKLTDQQRHDIAEAQQMQLLMYRAMFGDQAAIVKVNAYMEKRRRQQKKCECGECGETHCEGCHGHGNEEDEDDANVFTDGDIN
jgi:hypothetical protein